MLSLRSLAVAGLVSALIGASFILSRSMSYRYPAFNDIPADELRLSDIGCMLMGMRRVAADIAWVQLLQYYARPEMSAEEELEIAYSKIIAPEDKAHHESAEQDGAHFHNGEFHTNYNATGGFPLFLDKAYRVTRLDPFFYYAFLYSAGALAWNMERPDEAYNMLNKGIEYAPAYWQYSTYMLGIIYKKKGNYREMISVLEKAMTYADCPNLIKANLAKIYEQNGAYVKSLRLWITVFDSGDMQYADMARRHIANLRKILHLQ
jgi:tetratricopeptide (TPR) repeat protein